MKVKQNKIVLNKTQKTTKQKDRKERVKRQKWDTGRTEAKAEKKEEITEL